MIMLTDLDINFLLKTFFVFLYKKYSLINSAGKNGKNISQVFILDNYTTLVLIGHTMFSEKHTYLPTTIIFKKKLQLRLK